MPLTRTKKLLLSAVIILQVVFFVAWASLEADRLSDPESKTILVKVLPVDPRDYLSGNYFILRYEFSRIWNFQKHSKVEHMLEKEVYVVLKKKDHLFVPDYIALERPIVKDDQVILIGKIDNGNRGMIEYGIEKYFINEHLQEPDRVKDKIEALLLVGDDFRPSIKSIIVNGKKLR